MNFFRVHLRDWAHDRVLRRIARNSSYLFASNAINAVMSIVTANLLGVEGLGLLTLVTGLVSGINRLLSFRMGDLVVRYFGEYLALDDKRRASALVKAAGLTEAVTSLVTYAALVLLAPLALRYIIKDPDAGGMLLVYGLAILGNLTTETATGVLQVTNHYRSQALINLAQAVLAAALIIYASLVGAGIWLVLWVYLLGKLIMGLGPIFLALYHLRKILGAGWWRAPLSALPPFRELARFALSTNFSGTINQIARDSETLWVGYFFTTREAGYYKIALTLINLMIMPINPFISTSYPEITRAIVTREWLRLRSLLRRVSAIAAGWTGAVAIGLLIFGIPVLFQTWSIFGRSFDIYGPEFLPAYPALLILLVGFGTANILFWNRSLLLAMDMPDYPLKVAFWCMLAKVALAFVLVPRYGYLAEAALLSAYFVVSVGLIFWRGMIELRRVQRPQTAQVEL